MTTQTITQTAEILAAMLTENTGRHFLDSGGDSGRNWQRNQGLTAAEFLAMPAAWIDEDGATLSVFHYLLSRVTYAPELSGQFDNLSENSNASHYEDLAEFLELIGAKELSSDNTYNYDSALSQVIQYTIFDYLGEHYAAIQIHGGADVRGGYTRPRFFHFEESFTYDHASVTAYCYGCGFHAYLIGGYSPDYAEHGDQCKEDCQLINRQYPDKYRREPRDWRAGDGCPCCGTALDPITE
jgi:hypothetical protein